MGDGEPLTVWMMHCVYADDGGAIWLSQQKSRKGIVGRSPANTDTQVPRNEFDINRRLVNCVLLEKVFYLILQAEKCGGSHVLRWGSSPLL